MQIKRFRSTGVLTLAACLGVSAGLFGQSQSGQAGFNNGQRSAESLAKRHEASNAPTDRDLYCSGFITQQDVPESTFIAGGQQSPDMSQFGGHDSIFLTGSDFSVGQRFSVIRHSVDPDKYQAASDIARLQKAAGAFYDELGIVEVYAVRGSIGIARPVLSCREMVPGDIVVPFTERERPTYRKYPALEPWTPSNGKTTGRIILGGDYQYVLGDHHIAYLNVGTNQGVKAGDYFRVTRDYSSLKDREIDELSLRASTSDIGQIPAKGFAGGDSLIGKQKKAAAARLDSFPRQTLGDMMVLHATPTTSTALVMNSLQPMYVGDSVEMMEDAPPQPAIAMHAPTIQCSMSPDSVQVGQMATLTCSGTSEDSRPLTYQFEADRGQIRPQDNSAVIDTRNLPPGPVNITAKVMDDRDLSANAAAVLNVIAPPAPPAPKAEDAGAIAFKAKSAYVDNRAKAVLDGMALRLQQDPTATLVIGGTSTPAENAKLAQERAQNAKTYLTRDKGIDPNRIDARANAAAAATAPTASTGAAELWFVPAGAQKPF